MNDWNQLENRLASWKPRRPSAHLKDRIFHNAARQTESGPANRRTQCGAGREPKSVALPWLAPAMAMFLFLVFMTGRSLEGTGHWTFSPSNMLAVASLMGENSLAAYLSEAEHSPHNNWQATTFEWTNEGRSLTTYPPVPQTNSQIQ